MFECSEETMFAFQDLPVQTAGFIQRQDRCGSHKASQFEVLIFLLSLLYPSHCIALNAFRFSFSERIILTSCHHKKHKSDDSLSCPSFKAREQPGNLLSALLPASLSLQWEKWQLKNCPPGWARSPGQTLLPTEDYLIGHMHRE